MALAPDIRTKRLHATAAHITGCRLPAATGNADRSASCRAAGIQSGQSITFWQHVSRFGVPVAFSKAALPKVAFAAGHAIKIMRHEGWPLVSSQAQELVKSIVLSKKDAILHMR
jgi:hypothetical protein